MFTVRRIAPFPGVLQLLLGLGNALVRRLQIHVDRGELGVDPLEVGRELIDLIRCGVALALDIVTVVRRGRRHRRDQRREGDHRAGCQRAAPEESTVRMKRHVHQTFVYLASDQAEATRARRTAARMRIGVMMPTSVRPTKLVHLKAGASHP